MPTPDVNSWLEEELYAQFRHDQGSVDASWKQTFQKISDANGAANGAPANGHPVESKPASNGVSPNPSNGVAASPAPPSPVSVPAPTAPAALAPQVSPNQQLTPLKGAAGRLAKNMAASLAVPTATSMREVPVKVMEENRRLINQHRTAAGKSKVSYTHIIGYAIVQALKDLPQMNDAFIEKDGEAFRVVNKRVNFGVAVDLKGSGGSRSLVVPSIKGADEMTFAQYLVGFDDLVARARNNKLTVDDFQGTTISLTNPGTVGTTGSVPRLMPGMGCIVGTGSIAYPATYQGVSPEMKALIGLSATMTMTCTYDHRVIQGAESGMFLGRLQALLEGADGFYDAVFSALKIPYSAVVWQNDNMGTPRMLPGTGSGHSEVAKEASVMALINAYRVRGHLISDLDPLGSEPSYHPELDPATYGLTLWDLDREFVTGTLGEAMGEAAWKPVATLREILDTLRQTYCGKIGCEYMYIQALEEKRWLQKRLEPSAFHWPISPEDRVRLLERTQTAEQFEHFLHTRFVGAKRFSLEGAETTIAVLDELLELSATGNVHEVVIGMAHRGRLNVLANIVGKPMDQMFGEFEYHPDPHAAQGSGDVKYHLGATGTHRGSSGREVIVSVAPNPSHLEAVNPVVEGIVRPKQDRLGDKDRKRVIPVLIHGDAAFAGQGIVFETLNLATLDGYTTGGTVHVVINNQIGFTTSPEESRSSAYCTDVARTIQAPVFHVNGDDPEACIRTMQVAFEFRQKFGKDVVIDIVCYRRLGHNEGDDPSYTSPLIYKKIKDHPSVATLYGERLEREKVISADQIAKLKARIASRMDEGFEKAQQNKVAYEIQEMTVISDWAHSPNVIYRTAAERLLLAKAIEGMTTVPGNFNVHPKLKGFLQKRRDAIKSEAKVLDWAFAEALAFATLVLEGTKVRLSGQDSARGTFSQRHLELYDYEDGTCHIPLQHLDANQAKFEVWNSCLSEFAVMGYEFGYSVGDPMTLVLWEAQFGDFVNGAQVMIDQFITCCESKWGQRSGLVLMLPHGYEGQGPEHSSARMERFLVLCAEENIQVVNCTTPAQYFHVLRRQMYGGPDRRGTRKPLVIFTPKSLLRHPRVVSSLDELAEGSFQRMIPEAAPIAPEKVRRVLMCAGKVYYDLLEAREQRGIDDVVILRIEQIYPFPNDEIQDQLARYPQSADVAWVQEEPRNMGPWRFIRTPVQPMLEGTRRKLRYIGRPESASPATGSSKQHKQEQNDIVDAAFHLDQIAPIKKLRLVKRKI